MAGPVFARDRTTWTLYVQLSVFGYFLYGFGPSVSLLGHDNALSDGVAALHGTSFAIGAVAAGLTSAVVIRRLGRTRLQALALLLLVVGAFVYCLGVSLAATLTGALVTGCAGNLVVNVTAAALADHHGARATTAISEANGVSSTVGVLAPFSLGLATLLGLGWRVGLLLVVPLALITVVWSHRVRLGPAAPVVVDPDRGASANALPSAYWSAWWLFLLCAVVELSMTFWASEHLRLHTGMSQPVATMTITLMLVGIAAGRGVGAWLARRITEDRLLLGSISLNLAGFAAFWFASSPVVAGVGMALCGLGIAMQFPLTVSRAIARSGGKPDLALSRIAISEGIAAASGPFLLGLLAEHVSMHYAFLLVPALLLVAAVLVGLHHKRV
ncbi:MFS transporter [Umezawaea sp. NPDC059074]|uniref:MFS transporter n=1 Tax=Umezawaea sp. NPDC059074 TaxID=3346716 RepID=UPI0036B07020